MNKNLEYFPLPYRNELLYGTIARMLTHTKMGSTVFQRKCFSRFFVPNVDLPNRVETLVRQTSLRHYYQPDDLISKHTLFPFYSAFMPKSTRQALQVKMVGDSGQQVYHGMVFKVKTLRFCPECMKEDIELFGEPFWHRKHRVPGVTVCSKHRILLVDRCEHCGMKFSTGKGYSYTGLPEECLCGYPLTGTKTEMVYGQIYQKKADYAADVQSILDNNWWIDPSDLMKHYKRKLRGFGLASQGNFLVNGAWECLLSYYGEQLMKNMGVKNSYFRGEELNGHSLVHILLIRALFGSVAEFFSGLSNKKAAA